MTRVWIERITPEIHVMRLDDTRTKFFESLWSIPEGITYNAYLLTLPDHNVLMDGWRPEYSEDFMETLRSLVDPRDLDYVVVHHMEPDHSGTLPSVIGANKNVVVVGHPMSRGMISGFYGLEPRFMAVKDGETLKLGAARLRFIHTPWLHWPETIMSFLEDEEVLFSGDAFGGYSVPPSIYDADEETVGNYLRFARKYLATVIGHYRQYITKALDRLAEAGVSPRIIAPAHGLVWMRNPGLILDRYRSWARAEPKEGKVLVVYGSSYGATEVLAKAAIRMLEEHGCRVASYRFTDTSRGSMSDIVGDALDAAALVLGASTYEAGILPTMRYVAEEISWKAAAPKPVVILSSYGWGGVAARKLAGILEAAGFSIKGVVEAKGRPGDADLERLAAVIRSLSEDVCGK